MKENRKLFRQKELQINPNANYPHVEILDNGRDIFGNRLFVSPTLSYKNRLDNQIKAALLVSAAGEAFLKENSGILSNLNRTLNLLDLSQNDKIQVGKNGFIQRYNEGAQSMVSLLELQDKKYIVKTRLDYSNSIWTDPTQPYINEMIQTQTIEYDLKNVFKKARIKMPRFLMASGQFSLTLFEDGQIPHPNEFNLYDRKDFEREVGRYIENKKTSQDPLWRDIYSDYRLLESIHIGNFLKQDDGILVWVDPFYFKEEQT